MIAIINESSVLTDDEVKRYVAAYQVQVDEHFGPVWGMAAELQFTPRSAITTVANEWQLVFLDDTDQAGALGYHDETAAGKPLGKVFAGTDKKYGTSASVTGSHELLEMLGDPTISTAITEYDANGNVSALLAYEACDATEDDSYGYQIDGVLVSDFVYPSWFGGIEAQHFDFLNHCSRALEVLSNGYIGKWTPSGGWGQVNGEKAALNPRVRAPHGSRRERRARGRSNWKRSAGPEEIMSLR